MASAILFMASDLSSGITGQTPGRQLRGVQGVMPPENKSQGVEHEPRTDVGTVEDLKASATKAVGLDDFGTWPMSPPTRSGWPADSTKQPAAPQESSADRSQRSREALGTEEPRSPFALDALFATYPDALVIQCHRPARRSWRRCARWLGPPPRAGRTPSSERRSRRTPETWSRGLERFNPVRATRTRAILRRRLLQADSRPDPHRRRHLHRFGLELPTCAPPSSAPTRRAAGGPRAPKHTYSLARLRAGREQVKERFKGL